MSLEYPHSWLAITVIALSITDYLATEPTDIVYREKAGWMCMIVVGSWLRASSRRSSLYMRVKLSARGGGESRGGRGRGRGRLYDDAVTKERCCVSALLRATGDCVARALAPDVSPPHHRRHSTPRSSTLSNSLINEYLWINMINSLNSI